MPKKPKVLVVCGEAAGLMAALQLIESGCEVEIISPVPIRRLLASTHTGLNAALNTKGEADSPAHHLEDSLVAGDFLASQPALQAMCAQAPELIWILDRMGVPFTRTTEGQIELHRAPGTTFSRTAFAGTTTGPAVLFALCEQIQRYEVEGTVTCHEGWEFLSAALDDTTCLGIVAMELVTLEVKVFAAQAVVIAAGGVGGIFGRTTNAVHVTGSVQGALFRQGVRYTNAEFIQLHPATVLGEDKFRAIPDLALAEGGRFWVPRTARDQRPPEEIPGAERWYFLEEHYPNLGNFVPRDIATREIFEISLDGYGVGSLSQVYLDLTHLPPVRRQRRLGGIRDLYLQMVGEDVSTVPMCVFPGMHLSLGGLWVDTEHQTNIKGLFAAGECASSLHGANALSGNELLFSLFSGRTSGQAAARFAQGTIQLSVDSDSSLETERRRQTDSIEQLKAKRGSENAWRIQEKLGRLMTEQVTVVRFNERLQGALEQLDQLEDRLARIDINETNFWATPSIPHARRLESMLILARVIIVSALNRNESRGVHFKPEFPTCNNTEYLKTTVATFSETGPVITFEPIDTSLIEPRPREYN
ncbi:MAG: FAD-binding protein [Acidobacteria bacterium]|nr:FAD-binding protein [Acidobacteriota bacterium]